MASRDPNQIRKWWINDISGLEQEFNIGISTSNFKDGKALVVVDVDDKNGKKGSSLVVEYEMQGKEFPSTFEQITTTKGQHLVFVADQAVKQGTDVLGMASILDQEADISWPLDQQSTEKNIKIMGPQ